MKNTITIIMPKGALGASDDDTALDFHMRNIALAVDPEDKGWSSKYGADYENDVFVMRRQCWCNEDNCPRCLGDVPNFLHKKSGFSVEWYKYIGRGMVASKKISEERLAEIANECIASVGGAA